MTTDQKREYLKKYNEENREKIAAQRKKYRESNKEKIALQKKKYAEKNKEQILKSQSKKYRKNKEKYLLRMKEKYSKNSEEIKKKRMEYYYLNRDKILDAQKEAAGKNKEKRRIRAAAYCRKRRASDPKFLLIGRMRCRINDALRMKRFPKTGKTQELLGCDLETLQVHIESQFTGGMTWENRSEWHIDHKIPLSSAKTKEDIDRLFHYKNLQPLWGIENLLKGSKIPIND